MDYREDDPILKPSALAIRSRIRQTLVKAALTQAEASRRALEISPRAVKQLLSNAAVRGAKPRDPEVQRAFAEVLGVDPAWLWTGPMPRGRMFEEQSDQDVLDDIERDAAEIQADARPRADSGDAPLAAAGVLPMRPDPKMYAVPVATADWEPLSRVGDCILVTPSYPPAPGDLVYVRGGATPGLYRLVAGGRDEVYVVTPTGMPLRFLTTDIEAHRVGAIVFG